MLGHALRDPGLDASVDATDQAPLGGAPDDGLEGHAGHNHVAQARIQDLAIAAVAQDQPVLRTVIEREALRDALDRVGEPSPRLSDLPEIRRFGLPRRVAEHGQRLSHAPELVLALGGDARLQVPARDRGMLSLRAVRRAIRLRST